MDFLFFSSLVPYDTIGLQKRRLGKPNDGGYVIPLEILTELDVVLVFGINDEDSFEKDLAKYVDPKKIPFLLCDPYVQYKEGEKNNFLFFPIGLTGKSEGALKSWKEIQDLFRLKGKRIFLKIDIEGSEWEAFESVESSDLENVMCIVIEFHDLLQLKSFEQQKKVLSNLLKDFILIHLHSNNHGIYFKHPITGRYYPDVLECTYIRRDFLEKRGIDTKKRTTPFPSELDQPNTLEKPDIQIDWWV